MSDTSTLPLTGQQKNKLHEAVNNAPIVPDIARTGAANPNLRVFVANFDGTQNDRTRIPEGSQKTLVSDAFETFRDSDNQAIESRYYRGVGTNSSRVAKLIETALGAGCTRNAEKAHSDLVRQVEIWREENPLVEVHVHVTGFSRGSATALHFVNVVNNRGALPQNELNDVENSPKNLRPGFVKTSAVLLDTVSTGQESQLNLTIPFTCVAVLHVTAANEQRYFFPLREIAKGAEKEVSFAVNAHMKDAVLSPEGMVPYKRVQEVELPGVHSDIGGSYGSGGLREISKYLMKNFQESLGLGVTPVKPTFEAIQNCKVHDSRFVKLMDGATPNQEKSREIDAAIYDSWDGTYVQRTKITKPDGTVSQTMDMGQVKTSLVMYNGAVEAISKEPTFPYFYKANEVCVIPMSFESGMADDSYVSPNAASGVHMMSKDKLPVGNSVEIVKDAIYVLGTKMSQALDLEGLKKTWDRQALTAAGPQPFKVEFDVWRLGTMVSTRQDIDALPLPAVSHPADPWPKSMREAICLINSGAPMTQKIADSIMYKSQAAAAKTIEENFKDIKSVKVEPRTLIDLAVSEKRVSNTFAIKVERLDGSTFSSDQRVSGKDDFHLSNCMRDLRKGLAEVEKGLLEYGFKPARNSEQVFHTGEPSQFKDQRLVCTLSEPGVKPMMAPTSSMNVLGGSTLFGTPKRNNESKHPLARMA